MPEYGGLLGADAPFAIDRPVHLDDLVAGGVTKPLIDELVARDVIRRVTRATYVASQVDDSIELRARALGLVVPESAIVVDRTAAWLHGVDLLTYRHATADPAALTRAVVDASAGPVIAAGSVVTDEQIRLLAAAGAWGFTIGGAIFERRLPGGDSVAGQVSAVLEIAGNA